MARMPSASFALGMSERALAPAPGADILAAPAKDKLNVLIDINREIAAGLMIKPGAEKSPVAE